MDKSLIFEDIEIVRHMNPIEETQEEHGQPAIVEV
jgi:hypothetical protein